jgi:ABC-type multidrug transport system fused ATPase/permease subunit
MMAVMNMGRLISPIVAIAKASSAATELFVTIDAEKPDTSGLKEPDITANADIHLQDVSFSYPSLQGAEKARWYVLLIDFLLVGAQFRRLYLEAVGIRP